MAIILGAGFYAAATGLAADEALPQGVMIDGIPLAGMSLEEARAAVTEAHNDKYAGKSVEVTCDGVTKTYTYEDAGLQLITDDVFDELAGHISGSLFDQVDAKLALQSGWSGSTRVTYDKEKLLLALDTLVSEVGYPAQNAAVQFDADGTFTFVEAQTGKAIDKEALCDVLYSKLIIGDLSPLMVDSHIVEPAITRERLAANTVELATARTTVEGSDERKQNVQLITDAVNGASIMPGEVLSLNDLTGERTPEKGYQEAPAIRYGELTEEIGGGICQLSGTLFNAALLSDLDVIERHHHTWPSDYLPVGMDATITWPNKDLKIKNTTEWPVYIRAYIEDGELIVTCYGAKLRPDMTIELENDIYETIDAPSPTIEYDDTQPVTYKQTVVKERKGYRVRLYRHYYMDGELVESELIHNDRFYPIAGKIVMGSMEEEPVIVVDDPTPTPAAPVGSRDEDVLPQIPEV